MPPLRIVVLISGSGTNLQSLIDACQSGQIDGEIVGVISNKADAYGLQRAENHQISTIVLQHQSYSSRDEFDQALQQAIDSFTPELVVLAGFMRILGKQIAQHYHGRMFNIHPSLLPKYPGLHTHQRALEAGDLYHGCSIHFVTAELDGGPLVAQNKFDIEPLDTEESLKQKVQHLEHILYPQVVQLFCSQRLKLESQGATLDGELLQL
ncbi:MAG: phosphoribosylglycinamide formyltransferase [Gammaproteobacteria bacterium CG22_combo_CG10-13_8_21_14_all_40_8]|nr:MAG: phosphoribosylglycinamide formyltransferase [Gammaproteobacteria bacterium CG22_combo_CG10-13_8_21_14_all_40_8]